MTFTKPFASILLILLGFSIASGQNPAQVRKLKKELAKITGSKEFKTASIGFCLMDVETGKILVEENAEKSLIPASTIKLITTGAGLALLGDTFRFKTELGYTGEIKNGVLNGNLAFIGYGDPTLGSERWYKEDTLVTETYRILKDNNVSKVSGFIGVIEKIFDNKLPAPGVEAGDLAYYYGVPVFPFNYLDNTNYLYPDTLSIPKFDVLVDTIVYSLSEENNFVKPNEYNKDNYIKKQGFALYNPSRFLKRRFFYFDNMKRTEKVFGKDLFTSSNNYLDYMDPAGVKHLYTFYSPSLLDITTKTNHSSINLYAEGILRALSTNKYDYSTLDSSISIAKKFWKNEVGDLKGLRMTDGSGLSRSNLCTPLLFCKMLTSYTKRDNFNSFYSTIPIAGREGTVKNFAVGTAADGNAHIKSGSMSRVKCYAGYVTGKNGKLYAVSVMFNNFEPDATVTAACANLIGKVAELKGGKPKKTFVINRGNSK